MEHDCQVLGIDLGGTNMRMGLVSADGTLSHFQRHPVDRSLSGAQLVEWIAQRAEALTSLDNVRSVAIGVAGVVLRDQALRPGSVTLSSLGGFPLGETLAARFGKPCWVGNDADLALRGEAHFGAARGHGNVLLLTLGTGIGGGLLLNGRLREGPHGSSVEIGDTMLGYPTKERPASIESLYAPGAIMRRLGCPNGALFQKDRQRDPQARQLTEEMYQALGTLIANVHLLLDLELVLISGGLAAAGEELAEGLRRGFRQACPPSHNFGLQIRMGALPVDTAGVIGAACLWFESNGLLPRL